MNRRLSIFVLFFVAISAVGLVYTYSIPPTYIASASIQVDPGIDSDQGANAVGFVANEAHALSSNELLEAVLRELQRTQSGVRTFDSVGRLREGLTATALPGSNVIELQARGRDPAELVELLDTWTHVYVQSRGDRREAGRDASIEDARAAVAAVETRVVQKRRELDEFRRRHGIVSSERDENEVAAQVKSLLASVNEARSKAVDAESRLSTIKANLAEGKPPSRGAENAGVIQLEQRLRDLRQRLKDLELRFTPDYLAMDPTVKVMRADVKELEQQLDEARRKNEHTLVNDAAHEAAAAQKNLARLEAQFENRRKDALNFTSRFSEHKAQAAELVQLEAQLSQAKQRLATLERTERKREPAYSVLGRASVMDRPAHPDYARYSAYTLGGALGAALLAVLLADFLSPRRPVATPSYPQPVIQIAYPAVPAGALDAPRVGELPGHVEHSPRLVLAAPQRELTVEEVRAMWAAADCDARLVIAALFAGLRLDDLAALTWDSVDFDTCTLRLRVGQRHAQSLIAPLDEVLRARAAGGIPAGHVAVRHGSQLGIEDLEGLVAAAAHDGRVDQADTIEADTLRHTYITYLVKQGLRLSELEALAGPVPPASFLTYRKMVPADGRTRRNTVQRVFPAFAAA